MGELNPAEVVDVDFGRIASAVGHGHHATALFVLCAIPAIGHRVIRGLSAHGEAELVLAKRVGVARGVVDVLVSAEKLVLGKAPRSRLSLVLVLECHLLVLGRRNKLALAVVLDRGGDDAGVTIIGHAVGVILRQRLTVVLGLGHVERVRTSLGEGVAAREPERHGLATVLRCRGSVLTNSNRLGGVVGLVGNAAPINAFLLNRLHGEAEALAIEPVAARYGLAAVEGGRAASQRRGTSLILVGKGGGVTNALVGGGSSGGVVVAHLSVELAVVALVGHGNRNGSRVLVVGPALAVSALIEVGCADLGDVERVLANGVELDASERLGYSPLLRHTGDGQLRQEVRGCLHMVLPPLLSVVIVDDGLDLELEVRIGVSASHGLLDRDLLRGVLTAHDHRVSLVAVGDESRSIRGHALDVQRTVVLVVLVEVADDNRHSVRISNAVTIGIVERPAGSSRGLILLHHEGVGAGLAEGQLAEGLSLLAVCSDDAVRANGQLAFIVQTTNVGDRAVGSVLRGQGEGVVHAIRRSSTCNLLGHLERSVTVQACLSRLIRVGEAEGRNLTLSRGRVELVDHNLARLRTVSILDLGDGRLGVHGAVVVVVHCDVHAILALVVLDARKTILVGRVVLANREGEGLLRILLVERQTLQLLHGHGAVGGRGGIREVLSDIAIRAGALQREAEVAGSHGTVDHRLGHGDAAGTFGAIVHVRLVYVGELGMVGHIGVLVVAVAHGSQQLAVVVGIVAIVAVRDRNRHRGDVRVERHAVSVGGLGAIVVGDLVHLEGVRADLGEGHVVEREVHRVLIGDRHRLRIGKHRLGVVVERAQLEVEGLAFLHLTALEGLGAVDGIIALELGSSRLVRVGERDVGRLEARLSHNHDLRVRGIRILPFGDDDLDHIRGVLVVDHARFGVTLILMRQLGDAVFEGLAHIVAIKVDGRELEHVADVARLQRRASHTRRLGHGIAVRRNGVITRLRFACNRSGLVSAERLELEGELSGINRVAAGFILIDLGALERLARLSHDIAILECHGVALDLAGALSTVIVDHLLDEDRGHFELALPRIGDVNRHTVDSTGVIDARDGRDALIGVGKLLYAEAILARFAEGDVTEACGLLIGLLGDLDLGGIFHLDRRRTIVDLGDLERELVARAPIASGEVLLNLQIGLGAQLDRFVGLVVVLEGNGLLRTADDGAIGNAIGRVVVRIGGHSVRGGEAVLVGSGLRHGEGGARGQALDHGALAVLEGDGAAVDNRTVARRLLAGLVHVVSEVSVQRLVTVEVDGEHEAVLIPLGVVGGVAPVDALLDLQLAGQIVGDLTVVAQALGDAGALPIRGQHGCCGFRNVIRLIGIKRSRAVTTLRTGRDVVIALTVGRHLVPVLAVAVNRNTTCYFLSVAAGSDLPISFGVIQGVMTTDILRRRTLRAGLIDVEVRVLRVVVELVAVARRESGRRVARTAVIKVRVERDLAIVGLVGANDSVIYIAETGVDDSLRISLHAHAVEEADGVGIRHRHGLLIGVNVVVAHGDERSGDLHGHRIARGKIIVASNRHSKVGKVRPLVHGVPRHLALEVIGVDIAISGYIGAGELPIAIHHGH